jgi:hypothetical protein
MASLPTPDPSDRREVDFPPGSTEPSRDRSSGTSSGTWRRSAAIATATSGLLIGAVAVSAQFASADEPSLAASTAPVDSVPSTVADQPPVDAVVPNEGRPNAEADSFDLCISGHAGIDPDELELNFDGPPFDMIAERIEGFDPADGTCPSFPPGMDMMFGEDFAAFEDCLTEQLGDEPFDVDAGPFGPEFGPGSPANVIVDTSAGNGEGPGDLGMYEFGEGDGTISVTKTDGEVLVDVDGDVTQLDIGKPDAEWSAAHEACADLLPEGVETAVGGPVIVTSDTVVAEQP